MTVAASNDLDMSSSSSFKTPAEADLVDHHPLVVSSGSEDGEGAESRIPPSDEEDEDAIVDDPLLTTNTSTVSGGESLTTTDDSANSTTPLEPNSNNNAGGLRIRRRRRREERSNNRRNTTTDDDDDDEAEVSLARRCCTNVVLMIRMLLSLPLFISFLAIKIAIFAVMTALIVLIFVAEGHRLVLVRLLDVPRQSQQQYRRQLPQRLCLGKVQVPSRVDERTENQKLCIGQPLASGNATSNRQTGRVHILVRSKKGDVENPPKEEDAVTCLVFSEPLKNGSKKGVKRRDLYDPFMETSASAAQQQLRRRRRNNLSTDTTTATATTAGSQENSQEPDNDEDDASSCSSDEESVIVEDSGASGGVNSSGAMCGICLQSYKAGEAVAWSCNPQCDHAFHTHCITDWLIRQKTCPTCREPFAATTRPTTRRTVWGRTTTSTTPATTTVAATTTNNNNSTESSPALPATEESPETESGPAVLEIAPLSAADTSS